MSEDLPIYSPFKGVLPSPQYAKEVIAPPYDVLSSKEAFEKAHLNPKSFLHVSKAEIDLPEGIDIYSDSVYQKAKENFNRLLMEGVLSRSTKDSYYIYQLQMGDHVQTGLVVGASVKAYNENRIKRHEFTRQAKEDDRVHQIEAVNAQTGPALLINKEIPEVRELLKKETESRPPFFSESADYGVFHRLWVIDDEEKVAFITQKFQEQNCAYIADGHHRSAAASRVAAEKGGDGHNAWDSFLAVAFFAKDMKILEYNRVVKDLNYLSKDEFLEALNKNYTIHESPVPYQPKEKGRFGMYLDGAWYELIYKNPLQNDVIKDLDVSILSDTVLTPILEILDLRKSERIDFVGGIRGLPELEKRVNSKEMRAAFSLYPTSVQELMKVADNKKIMPPKSTWFEPKLADGVVSKLI